MAIWTACHTQRGAHIRSAFGYLVLGTRQRKEAGLRVGNMGDSWGSVGGASSLAIIGKRISLPTSVPIACNRSFPFSRCGVTNRQAGGTTKKMWCSAGMDAYCILTRRSIADKLDILERTQNANVHLETHIIVPGTIGIVIGFYLNILRGGSLLRFKD